MIEQEDAKRRLCLEAEMRRQEEKNRMTAEEENANK